MATTEEFKDGGSTSYSFSIEYIKASDIKVKIDGAAQTYTTNASPSSGQYKVVSTTVTLGAAAASGTGNVHIYRETDLDTAGATFVAGSSIRAADLNAIHDLTRLASQEQNQIVTTEDIRDSAVTSAKIADGTIVNADVNASAAIAGTKVSPNFGSQAVSTSGTLASGAATVTGNISVSGTVDGRDVAADGTKLDGIESGATADQTNAEIRAAVEAASDSNVFTDADHSKLNAIEANATADQSNAEIRAAVEAATDSNVFTDADHSKLNAIEAGATADQTASEIRTLVESASDSNVFTDADHTKVNAAATVTGSETLTNKTLTSPVINDMSGTAVVTSGTSTSDTKTYSAKRAGEIFYGKDTVGEIQSGETWSAADDKVATTSAIDARIIDLVDDVGGFVPIANETSFPNANPDVNNGAGTLVSIKALSSNLTSNGSGVATIANGTVGNSTVTITGLANSTTYNSGFGMIVETTTTLNTYTFHRQVPKATEVTTVAGSISNVNTVAGAISNVNAVAGNATNINTVAGSNSNITSVAGSISNVNSVASNLGTVNDFAARYRTGANNPTSSLDTGDLFFNTSANELKVYNGSSWQGGVTASGNFASITGNTFTGDNLYNDSVKAKFGTGSDLEIFHNGFNSKIADVGTGALILSGSVVKIENAASNETQAVFTEDGAVELYFNNSKKLETNNDGVVLSGDINLGSGRLFTNDNGKLRLGGSQDLQIYHDGTNSHINNSTGFLVVGTDSYAVKDQTLNEFYIKALKDGGVELYYDNVLKLNTESAGTRIQGQLILPNTSGVSLSIKDGGKGCFGNSDDLQIYHDGSNSYISDTGTGRLLLKGSGIRLLSAANDNFIHCNDDGAIELYYDNSKKFETSSSGVRMPDTAQFELGDGSDLKMWHSGSHSFIRNETGNLTIEANGAGDDAILIIPDGAVRLFYDGTLKLTTTNIGIEVAGQVHINDNSKFSCGDSADLEIFHNGTNSIIDNNTGDLTVSTTGSGDDIFITCADNFHVQLHGSENGINAYGDGSVDLFYDGAKKFETTSDGTKVTGNLTVTTGNSILTNSSQGQLTIKGGATYPGGAIKFAGGQSGATDQGTLLFYAGTDTSLEMRFRIHADGRVQIPNDTGKFQCGSSSDLEIYHDGNDNHIDFKSGQLNIRPENTAGTYENGIIVYQNGAVELYYNDSKKFETNSSGVIVSGNCQFGDGVGTVMGASNDFQIYHDQGNGSNTIDGLNHKIELKHSGEKMIVCNPDDSVELYHNNILQLETTNQGINVKDDSGAVHIELYTNGSTRRGYLYADDSNRVHLLDAQGHKLVMGQKDAHTSLYYDNSQKFYTQSYGCVIDGTLKPAASNTHSLGDNSYRFHTIWAKNTARAWINVDGDASTASIRASHNVSSLTDDAYERHTVNFSTNMPNTNYCFVSGARAGSSGGGGRVVVGYDAPAESYFKYQMRNLGNSNEHVDAACLAFFTD